MQHVKGQKVKVSISEIIFEGEGHTKIHLSLQLTLRDFRMFMLLVHTLISSSFSNL